MRRRHVVTAAVATIALPHLLASPAFAEGLAAPLTPEGPVPDTLALNAAGQTSAPALEQVATPGSAIPPDQVSSIRNQMLVAMNEMAAEDFGQFTAQKGARIGRTNYYEDRDIKVHVVAQSDGSVAMIAVPLHTDVFADGSVGVTDKATANGIGSPIFGGKWGTQITNHYVLTHSNDGGDNCSTSTAENRMRYSRAWLADSSPTKSYMGVSVSGVVEITEFSNGGFPLYVQCEDWLDYAEINYHNETPGSTYVQQSPLVDYDGECTSTNLTVSASVGHIGASVSQEVQRCEKWDVYGGNAGPASTFYGIKYDNNDKCGPQSRELSALAVVELGQGQTHSGRVTYGVWPGNGPSVPSFCSGQSCTGS